MHTHLPVLLSRKAVEKAPPRFRARTLAEPVQVAESDSATAALEALRRQLEESLSGDAYDLHTLSNLHRQSAARAAHFEPLSVKYGHGSAKKTIKVWTARFPTDLGTILWCPSLDQRWLLNGKSKPEALVQKAVQEWTGPPHHKLEDLLALPEQQIMDLELKLSWKPDRELEARSGQPAGRQELQNVGKLLNTKYPNRLKKAWHRVDLLDALYPLLFSKRNHPVVLVGPEGSGRHSLVEACLARHMAETRRDRQREIWQVDPNRIISGMTIVGQWEARLHAMLTALKEGGSGAADGGLLLIDQPLPLLHLGSYGQSQYAMSHQLASWMEKGALQLILVATPAQWATIQDRHRKFADLIQVFPVAPVDELSFSPMLIEKKRDLENRAGLRFSVQALEELLALYRRHLRPQPLPGAIGTLMDRLAMRMRGQTVRAADVESFFYQVQGISPAYWQLADATDFKQEIEARLIGQPEAAEAIVEVLALLSARLDPPAKPISSLLFIGPTGVGKTQAAKVLCRTMLGDEDLLLRFDMSEFIDPGAAERLIGSIAQPDGQLTSKVRYQPHGILLLDEIEKAHPDVHDLLLQVLDEGRLTDARGQLTWFHNLVIIMTSNLGVEEASHQLGFTKDQSSDRHIFEAAAKRFFKPEFFNRIDQLVVFHPLGAEDVHRIARLQIKELLQRDGFLRRTTLLTIDQNALEWVSGRGYDPQMGGRALKRQIERDLTTLSADQLLQLPHDLPVLLEIGLKEGRLFPYVEVMDVCPPLQGKWLPDLPEGRQARYFQGELLRRLEGLEAQLGEAEPSDLDRDGVIGTDTGRKQWALYHYKERIASTQEELRHQLAGSPTKATALPLRFKHAGYETDDGTTLLREASKPAQLIEPEMVRRLSDVFRLGIPIWDHEGGNLLRFWVRVALLEKELEAVKQGKPEPLSLWIKPRIAEGADRAIAFMVEQYQALFKDLDLNFEWQAEDRKFALEGYGLARLLGPETGLHLFFAPYQNPIPIEFILTSEEKGAKSGHAKASVLRIYDDYRLVTDLRSATTCQAPYQADEYSLMLYAGLIGEAQKV